MAIRTYNFNNISELERTFSIGEPVNHQSLLKLEISFDNGNTFEVVDINKYEIIDKSLIVFNKDDYFKNKKNVKISVADTSSELGEVAIPFTSDIKNDNSEITDDELFIANSLIEDTNIKNNINTLATEINVNSVTISNNKNTVVDNKTTIENNVVDINDSIDISNNIINDYRKINNSHLSLSEQEPFNDDYTFDTVFYDNLKDTAINNKDLAVQYADEADVSNNLDLSRITTAKSSIDSSVDNIMASTKTAREQRDIAVDKGNRTLFYEKKTSNAKIKAENAATSATNDANTSNDIKTQVLDITNNITKGSVTDIINDNSVESDKTYSSNKVEDTLNNVFDTLDVKTSQELDTIKNNSDFGNEDTFNGTLNPDNDRLKIFKDSSNKYGTTTISEVGDIVRDKDFMYFNTKETNIDNNDKFLYYNTMINQYKKLGYINFQDFGNKKNVGYEQDGITPIIRTYYTLDVNYIVGNNFEFNLGNNNIGTIYKIKANINNNVIFQEQDFFIEGGILKIPNIGYANCNLTIDSTIIDVINDDPLQFFNNFDSNNTNITNATYDTGDIVNDINKVSDIYINEYEQEQVDGAFKYTQTDLWLDMNNLNITNANTLTFDTTKLIEVGDSIYVDNLNQEKLIGANEINTQVINAGDLGYLEDTGYTDPQILKNNLLIGKDYTFTTDLYSNTKYTNNVAGFDTLGVHIKIYSKDINQTLLIDKIILPHEIFGTTDIYDQSIGNNHFGNLEFDYFTTRNAIIDNNILTFGTWSIYTKYTSSSTHEDEIYVHMIRLDLSTGNIITTNQIGYNNTTTGVKNGFGQLYNQFKDGNNYILIGYDNDSSGYIICKTDNNFNIIGSKIALPDNNMKYSRIHNYSNDYYLFTPYIQGGVSLFLINKTDFSIYKQGGYSNSIAYPYYDSELNIVIMNAYDSNNYRTTYVYDVSESNFGNLLYQTNTVTTINFMPVFSHSDDTSKVYFYNIYYNDLCALVIKKSDLSITNDVSGNYGQINGDYNNYVFGFRNNDKNTVFLSTEYPTERLIINNKPGINQYTVNIGSLNLDTAPTTVWQKPEIEFKSGLSDTTGILPADLTTKTELSREITSGDELKISFNKYDEDTNTKRFFMWEILASNFNKLKKVITFLKKKG